MNHAAHSEFSYGRSLSKGADLGRVLSDKLKKLFGDVPQRKIAKEAGMQPSSLNYYFGGKYKKDHLPAEIAKKLEPVLARRGMDTTALWNLTQVDEHVTRVQHSGTYLVPLVGTVEAGKWGRALQFEADDAAYVEFPNVMRRMHGYDDTFLLEVRGSSMNKRFAPGTLIECVHPSQFNGEVKTDLYVVVERQDRFGQYEATVKQLEIRDDQYWLWPRSNDPEWQQPLRVPPASEWNGDPTAEVRIIGVVVFVHGPPMA